MNLYDKELNYLIELFKDQVSALTLNKNNVQKLEQIISSLQFNNIVCGSQLTTHAHDKSVSAVAFLKTPSDTDVLRALAITCAHLDVTHEAIELLFNIDSLNYGYSITGKDGEKITVSVHDIRNEYSPLDIERLLNDFKEGFSAPFFVGIDMAAGSDVTCAEYFRKNYLCDFKVTA